jgi:hypothetical protein
MADPVSVAVVIPALNEEGAIGDVAHDVPPDLVGDIIVVDNGSTDRTAARTGSGARSRCASSPRGRAWSSPTSTSGTPPRSSTSPPRRTRRRDPVRPCRRLARARRGGGDPDGARRLRPAGLRLQQQQRGDRGRFQNRLGNRTVHRAGPGTPGRIPGTPDPAAARSSSRDRVRPDCRRRCRADEYEVRDAAGAGDGELLRDQAPHGMSDDRGAPDAGRVHERGDVRGEVLDAIAGPRTIGAPVPPLGERETAHVEGAAAAGSRRTSTRSRCSACCRFPMSSPASRLSRSTRTRSGCRSLRPTGAARRRPTGSPWRWTPACGRSGTPPGRRPPGSSSRSPSGP